MSGAGLAIGRSEYQREADAYLQQRLLSIYTFVLTTSALFAVLDLVSTAIWPSTKGDWPHMVSRAIHYGGIALLAGHFFFLRRLTLAKPALLYFDAFVVLGSIATTMGIYAIAIGQPGSLRMVWIASLLVVGRGIAVPSSVGWTFLLSLSAPVGLLAVRLFHPNDGIQLMWDVAVSVFAVAIASYASAINFRLREDVRTARQLGQYRLEEQLGAGAMGTVYRATHSMLRRPTAIKVLRPDIAGEETVARFEREVQHTAQLQHPNTISIYDYGRTPDGLFYYAMELLDGEDLATIVKDAAPLPAARVIHILRQVAGSLHEAHVKGLIHRDVKPGNIVLCRRAGLHDVAKVLDFGLVKDLGETEGAVTQVGAFCGTPETIAPEVLSGDEPDARADIYALGIVGYQLLSGRLPFDARTAAEMIGAQLHEEPTPLDGPPEDLAQVVMKCLAKRPDDRPASASAFRESLGLCADSGHWTEEAAAEWWSGYRAGSR